MLISKVKTSTLICLTVKTYHSNKKKAP